MSVFTWGKLKFSKQPEGLANFEKNGIWVMFDLPDDIKYPLRVSQLEEGEIYFDILCDYETYRENNVDPYDYANNDCFFLWDLDNESKGDYKERIGKIQRILEYLLNLKNVVQLSLFNTSIGPPCAIEEYVEVNWSVREFTAKFIEDVESNNFFLSTIKVNLTN